MAVYNLSGLMQANSTLEYVSSVNDTLTWFPIMLVVAIFAVIMLSLKSEDVGAMLMVAGFFTTAITGLFWLSGYIPFLVFVFCIVVTVIATLITTMQGGK